MHVYSVQAGETEAVRVFTQKPAEGAVGGVGSGNLLVVDGYCYTVGRGRGSQHPDITPQCPTEARKECCHWASWFRDAEEQEKGKSDA